MAITAEQAHKEMRDSLMQRDAERDELEKMAETLSNELLPDWKNPVVSKNMNRQELLRTMDNFDREARTFRQQADSLDHEEAKLRQQASEVGRKRRLLYASIRESEARLRSVRAAVRVLEDEGYMN